MGSGSHFETLPGYGNPKPVAALRETTQLMRALWAGEKITLDGQVVKFKDGALDWKPSRHPADLYRQPRPANPQARRRDRRRRPDRQLLDGAGHRIRQAANPAGARARQAQLERHPDVLLDLRLGARPRGRAGARRHPARRELRVLEQPQSPERDGRRARPRHLARIPQVHPRGAARMVAADHGRAAPPDTARHHRQPGGGGHRGADRRAAAQARGRRDRGGDHLAVSQGRPGDRGFHGEAGARCAAACGGGSGDHRALSQPPPARGRSTREAGRVGGPASTQNLAWKRDPHPAPSAPSSPFQGEGTAPRP